MSSCLATTRHTLSPCLVLRNMATSSSWERPVMSTPFTWTHVCTWFQWISYANSQWVFPFKVVTYYYTRNIPSYTITRLTSSILSPDCRRPSLTAAPLGKMFLTRMGPGPCTEESLVTTVKPRPSGPVRRLREFKVIDRWNPICQQ